MRRILTIVLTLLAAAPASLPAVSRYVVAGPCEERFRVVSIAAGTLLMVWDDGGFEVPLAGRP